LGIQLAATSIYNLVVMHRNGQERSMAGIDFLD
jgi:hypothetical protein